MVERGISERFCIWWWPDNGYSDGWMQHLASLIGWPVMIETDNTEELDGGGA